MVAKRSSSAILSTIACACCSVLLFAFSLAVPSMMRSVQQLVQQGVCTTPLNMQSITLSRLFANAVHQPVEHLPAREGPPFGLPPVQGVLHLNHLRLLPQGVQARRVPLASLRSICGQSCLRPFRKANFLCWCCSAVGGTASSGAPAAGLRTAQQSSCQRPRGGGARSTSAAPSQTGVSREFFAAPLSSANR